MKPLYSSCACPALAVAVMLGVVSPATTGWSQGKPKRRAATAAPAGEMARVRLWKTELKGFPSLRVAFRAGEGRKTVVQDVGTGGPGYVFNEYVDVPAGRGVFELFAGQDKPAVASLPAELAQKFHVTVLLSEPAKAGEPPRMELIGDSDASPAAPAQISVRNFVAELKNVRVNFGEKLNAQFDEGLGYLLMRGITPAFYRVQTAGTSATGEPFEWTTEVDLRQNLRQTLVIYPDPYGRIRPRVIVDNEPATAPPGQKDG